jgi:acyl-coenzyme A thioesterase PaaI-like protein
MTGVDARDDRAGDAAAAMQAWAWRSCPIYEYIGMQVLEVGERIVCAVPLTGPSENHIGSMHAAAQWAMAEAVGGIAYFHNRSALGRCWIVVERVEIDFIAVARSDVTAEAQFGPSRIASLRSALDHHKKARFELRIDLLDSNRAPVARATGHYYLRRDEPSAAVASA